MNTVELFKVEENDLENIISKLDYESFHAFNQDVEEIKDWVKTQNHIPETMDYNSVRNFLLLNKGNVEKSKERIDNYYKMRKDLPEVFKKSNPKLPYLKHIFENFWFVPLPKLTKDKYRVFFFKQKKPGIPKNFKNYDMVKYIVNIQEIRLFEDITHGDIFIFDGKDVPIRLLFYITPSFIYKTLDTIYKNVFSSRLKGVYILNPPIFTSTVLTFLKPIMKSKLLDRIQICPDSEFLLEAVGKKVIPVEYGGEEKSFNDLEKMVFKKMKEYQKRFDQLDDFMSR